MPPRKLDLAALSREAGGIRRAAPLPAKASRPAAKGARAGKPPARQQAKCRIGTKAIVGHFEPEIAWRLRELAAARHTTLQAMLEEALDDLFAKHRVGQVSRRR